MISELMKHPSHMNHHQEEAPNDELPRPLPLRSLVQAQETRSLQGFLNLGRKCLKPGGLRRVAISAAIVNSWAFVEGWIVDPDQGAISSGDAEGY